MFPSSASVVSRVAAGERMIGMLEACTVLSPIQKMQILAVHLTRNSACRLTLSASPWKKGEQPLRAAEDVRVEVCQVLEMFGFFTGAVERKRRLDTDNEYWVYEIDFYISKRASLVDDFLERVRIGQYDYRPRWLIDASDVYRYARRVKVRSPKIYQEYLEARS